MRKLIFIIVIVIGLLMASYLLFSRPKQTTREQQSANEQSLNGEKKTDLEGLAKALSVSQEATPYNYMDWVDEKKQTLPLSGMYFSVGTNDLNASGKYKKLSDDDLNQITVQNLNPVITDIDTYFLEKGFTKNKQNTRLVDASPIKIAYYGYEKGPLKCVIRINEFTNPFGIFVCGNIDTAQAEKQQQFQQLFIGPDAKDKDITSFRVEKIENDFALGSASGNVMGYMWIAKNVNGKWNIVWTRNEIPLCSAMRSVGIPQSIYTDCYEDK